MRKTPVEINLALVIMITSIKHYSKLFHHVKQIQIIIREERKSDIINIFKFFNY